MKVSIIDLGFNSAKLVNYCVNRKNKSFKAYEQEGAKVRLGQDLHHNSILGREPIQRTIHTLKLFRDIVNFQCVKYVLSIATSAVREADNKNDFLREVLQAQDFVLEYYPEKKKLSILISERSSQPAYPQLSFSI